ncbi:autotransporter assembly complex protein TamA [Facilibium subflavum]|uniref:autotransporter assembly complex protein TamA n=1 Tax=Facilibium subflavum TaxID=2219058 RepID=UPI001AAD3E11|nr:POTRA domain-containing protein [Facilibium subflavum]
MSVIVQVLVAFMLTLSMVWCAYAQTSKSSLIIQINGIKDKSLQKELSSNLTISRFKDYASEHPNQIPILMQKSKSEIITLLQPYGYYQPDIDTKLTQANNQWLVTFNIQLNQPLKINQLQIEIKGAGKSLKSFQDLLDNFPLKQGNVLTQQAYEKAKTALTNTAFDEGFLDAQLIAHQIRIDLNSYHAQVILTLDTGSRYRIGKITINQKRFNYDENLINRLIRLNENDLFTQHKITQANKRLQDSGYFSGAQIVPQISKRDTTNYLVPVNVQLTAGYARVYSFGVGYGSFTGPRVSFGTLFRHVTDSGQQFSFNTQASPANTSFSTVYTIPGKDPLHDNWQINAQQDYIQTDTYNERQTNFGFSRTHKYGHWHLSFGIQQYFTNYDTSAQPNDEYGKYFVPTFSLRFDNMREYGFWKAGLMVNNIFQTAVKSLSDQHFVRNATSATLSIPLMKEYNRIVLDGNFGAMDVSNIQSIAPNFRFYAGGIGNLLGYPYLSQGPAINGNITGGKYLATAFAGVEQRIYGNFSMMLYYNTGNASNKIDFSDVEILRAAGIGLSYKTPLGPFMLFLSRTLNPGDEHWRADISIGITL